MRRERTTRQEREWAKEREEEGPTVIDAIKKYIDLKWEFFQLTLAKKGSLLMGNIVFFIVIALLALVVFVLLIILVDRLLDDWIGIDWLTSIIEIGFVSLLILALCLFKKHLIVRPAANIIIRILFDDSDHEETKRKKKYEEEDEEDED